MNLNPYESPLGDARPRRTPARQPDFSVAGAVAGIMLGGCMGIWIAPASHEWPLFVVIVGAATLGGLAGSIFRSL